MLTSWHLHEQRGLHQNKVTSSLACIHGQVTKFTTVKWPIIAIDTRVLVDGTSIFSRQMEAVVFIILQIFFATRAVVKSGEYLTIRLRARVFYEQIVNGAQPS